MTTTLSRGETAVTRSCKRIEASVDIALSRSRLTAFLLVGRPTSRDSQPHFRPTVITLERENGSIGEPMTVANTINLWVQVCDVLNWNPARDRTPYCERTARYFPILLDRYMR